VRAVPSVGEMRCRACGSLAGEIVLDLGEQPACDHFPLRDDPRQDPVYPLEMWLCAGCGLAQLVSDPTVPEEPRGAEPAALVEQAADAVRRVADAGWLSTGDRVAEYGSPHGGSWGGLLRARGLRMVGEGESAEVVLDCFGLMHRADQEGALAERAARIADGGVLLLQFHSLATILRRGQWNSLRHGHYAYYSTPALSRMLAAVDFAPRSAWTFNLYGGTVLLAATPRGVPGEPDESVTRLAADEKAQGVLDPGRVRVLHSNAVAGAQALRSWLVRQHAAGSVVLGYGAASRAVSLLCSAGANSSILPAIADASPAKQGRRMPGTDIAVIEPDELAERAPDAVLLFLPDLLDEVRHRIPQIEAAGGKWIDVEALTSSV